MRCGLAISFRRWSTRAFPVACYGTPNSCTYSWKPVGPSVLSRHSDKAARPDLGTLFDRKTSCDVLSSRRCSTYPSFCASWSGFTRCHWRGTNHLEMSMDSAYSWVYQGIRFRQHLPYSQGTPVQALGCATCIINERLRGIDAAIGVLCLGPPIGMATSIHYHYYSCM